MKITTTLLYPLAMFAALSSLGPISAHAVERSPGEVLNIDFNSTKSGKLSPTFSGVSPLGGGVFWNGLLGNALGGVAKGWTKGLMQSDASSESHVTISQKGFIGANSFLFEKDGVTPSLVAEKALLVDAITTPRDVKGELTISGVKPNTPYDLALFGRASKIGTRFCIGAEEKATSAKGPSDLPMVYGRDYVVIPQKIQGQMVRSLLSVQAPHREYISLGCRSRLRSKLEAFVLTFPLIKQNDG
jgi:hypothetical protein